MRNNRVFKQKLVKWIRPRRQDGLVARAFITRISNNHNSGHLIKKADTYMYMLHRRKLLNKNN